MMRISKLRLKNFRCFENLELSLNQNLNILIGVNGAGKSTILDGLAIALGGYLSGFDNIRSNYIQQEDVHYKMFEAGSRIDAQEQFPVEVYAKAEFDQRETRIIEWQRELNGIGRRTTHGNLKLIVEHAKFLQDEVRSGRKGCVLPLVAYYGTGRLWLQKRNRTTHVKGEKLNRQMAYVDCIAAESNEKQMVQWFEDMTYIQLQEGHAVPELEAVKRALRKCYLSVDKNVTDAKFAYNVKNHELEITIFRDDSAEKFPVRMLSDGEKGIISLVADIAYRMALLNPDLLENVLETPGVVLIDEIDMHLHPMWQKKIVADLTNTFPNVQFVMTTHSPSILVNVSKENIWVLDRFKLYQPESKTYGKTVGEVLQEVMDINVQPDYILELQKEFDDAIDMENFEEASSMLGKMKDILGEDAKAVIENQIVFDVEAMESSQ